MPGRRQCPRERGQPQPPRPAPRYEAPAVLRGPASKPAGRPSPGGRPLPGSSANSLLPCGGPGPRAARGSARPSSRRHRTGGRAARRAPRARRRRGGRRGLTGTCQRPRHGTSWGRWPPAAGPSRHAMRMPRARGAWPLEAGAGRGGAAAAPRGSHVGLQFSGAPARAARQSRRAFPPLGSAPSCPRLPRPGLRWLCQDVGLSLIATTQMAQFRPRRL